MIPQMSAMVVSSGSARMHARMRVTARNLNESTATASSASICSVTFMAPSSAPMPAPTRPATSRAVMSGPVSRTSAIASPAGIIASAPKRSSEARVCIDSTTPTDRPAVATSGIDFQPISNVCLAISRNSYGRRNASHKARAPKRETSPTHARPERMSTPVRSTTTHPFCNGRAMELGGWLDGCWLVGLPSSLRRGGGALRCALILDVVLLHLAVERRPVQAQDLRGFLLVPVGALQGLQDRHFLDLRQRAMRRDRELLSRRSAFLADSLRKIGGDDLTRLADEHRPLDGIFQLAHVAGPAVTDEQVVGRRRDRFDVLLVALVELLQKVRAQERNVFGALPQRRHP